MAMYTVSPKSSPAAGLPSLTLGRSVLCTHNQATSTHNIHGTSDNHSSLQQTIIHYKRRYTDEGNQKKQDTKIK